MAILQTELQPHQKRALQKALLNNLILAHSTGSGKTLTSIAIANALGKPTTVLTPASLVRNYEKEIKKHLKGKSNIKVLSLPTAVKQNTDIPEGNTVILDEAHSLRNSGTAKQAYIKKQLKKAGRIIALTGTPAYNQVADWAPLVNIISQDSLVPENTSDFKQKYIREIKTKPSMLDRLLYGIKPGATETLKNEKELYNKVSKYIDSFNTDIEKPQRLDEVIKVPMSPEQEEVYRYVSRSMPVSLRYKIAKNLPPSKQEAKMMNAFLNDTRQVANTPEKYQNNIKTGSKLKKAVDNLKDLMNKDKNFKALVYSNYLDSGINAYAKLLDKEKIPYSVFNGSLTAKKKQEIVDKYNKGEIPIILGSGSASEGLDLQGTKLIQILEPHFNNSKIEQVIGRGIRYKSHSHLPKEEQKVIVQKYLSTLSELPKLKKMLGYKKDTSVDEYLTGMADKKDALINQLKEVLAKE